MHSSIHVFFLFVCLLHKFVVNGSCAHGTTLGTEEETGHVADRACKKETVIWALTYQLFST